MRVTALAIGRSHCAAGDAFCAAAICILAISDGTTHNSAWPLTQLMQSRACKSSHKPGRGLLLAKGLPVKDAARIAHFGLAVRLLERERTGAMGVPLAANFFCIPFNALHGCRHVMHWQEHATECLQPHSVSQREHHVESSLKILSIPHSLTM